MFDTTAVRTALALQHARLGLDRFCGGSRLRTLGGLSLQGIVMTNNSNESGKVAQASISDEVISLLPPRVSSAVREALRNGELNDALRIAIDAAEVEASVDVLRLCWVDLLRDERRARTTSALEQLSAAKLTAHPLLAMALGFAYYADGFRRSKAISYFGFAAVGVRAWAARASAADKALIHTSESAAFRLMGKMTSATRSARSGVAALKKVRDEDAKLIGYLPRVYAQLGTSLYYGGHESEAMHVFARGFAEAGTSDQSSFGNLSMLAGIHALAGDTMEAAQHAEILRGEPWVDEQRSAYPGTFYRLAEALIALEQDDAAAARDHLGAMTSERRTIEHWVAIAKVEALTALLENDAARGLAELEALVTLRGAEGHASANRHRLASIRALLHVALGNYEAASNVLRHDGDNTPQVHVDRARLALTTERTSDALRELRAIAGKKQSSRTLAEALVIEAAVALRVATGQRAKVVLTQLESVLRATGLRTVARLIPAEDVRNVGSAAEALNLSLIANAAAQGSLLICPDKPVLTVREIAVLNALVRSGAVADIAAELFVSANTVKTQLKSLYRKLGARNRDEALTIAINRYLIDSSSMKLSDSRS